MANLNIQIVYQYFCLADFYLQEIIHFEQFIN